MVKVYSKNKIVEVQREDVIHDCEVAKIPGTDKYICRTTIPFYKNFVKKLFSSDDISRYSNYHPDVISMVYNVFMQVFWPVEIEEDIGMLIQDGYIYMFPELKQGTPNSYDILLMAEDLFEKRAAYSSKTP